MELPSSYYLEHDPDSLILRRVDGSIVGAFSVGGTAPKVILEAIEETTPRSLENGSQKSPRSAGLVLQARFFGYFELLRNGEVVPLGGKGKALAILKYLLANPARPVSQDHLMGWLWPESNLTKARWSLNSAIRVLRKLLNQCPSSSTTVNHILLQDGYYRVCPTAKVETDVNEFDAGYEQGRRLEKEGRTEEAAVEYAKTIKLYRDDYLMEDLYEDWTMVERERLAHTYLDMLGRLAVHYVESGQYDEAINASYRLLMKDRCHEGSYRVLMRSYLSLGLRGRALHQYRLCKLILKQEYGVAPLPETEALYKELLSGHH